MAEKDNLIIGIILIVIVALLVKNFKLQVSDSSLSSISSKAIFSTTGISKDIFAVAGSCRPDGDGEWCCDNSNYVICGNTDVCGPSEAWCSNFLNPQLSCDVDSDRCCDVAGHIYQYPVDLCCPPDFPYYSNVDGRCYTTPQPGSDNYYTRQSDCFGSQDKCEERNYNLCVEVSDNIYLYSDYGITVGKCGVECFSGETKCEGVNNFICQDYKYINQEALLNQCGVECLSVSNCPNQLDYDCTINKCVTKQELIYYRLENNQCNQISLLPSEKTFNDYDLLTECESEIQCITNWQCSSWSNCLNGKQERVCTDINNCGITDGKPIGSQSCGTGITGGGGGSVTCTSDTTKQCYDNDVYYYDSCNIRGSKFQECKDGCLNAQCKTKTFFDKYGGYSFILLIVISLGIWLLLRSKK